MEATSNLIVIIVKEFHEGTHEGIFRALQHIRSVFHWHAMKKTILDLVRKCDVCQKQKGEHTKPGLLQPLPIPLQPWPDISMDFIEALPLGAGKNTILVVIDRFTEYAHFAPLSQPYTAQSVAKLFYEHIFRLHGMPTSIVCKWDNTFTSGFWKELFSLQGSHSISVLIIRELMAKRKLQTEH